MAGFGQNRKATAVHDPLMARAIVFKHGTSKIALVSINVVGLFHANVLDIRAKLPGFTYVLVSSTHNHEGPDTLGLWGPNPFISGLDKDYLKHVEARIVEAVTDAEKTAVPVTARIGTAKAPELLHDSREPYIKHDELVAVQFFAKSGRGCPRTPPAPVNGGEGPAPHVNGGEGLPPRQRGGGACPHVNGGEGPAPHVNGGEGPAHVNGGEGPYPPRQRGGRACPPRQRGGRALPPRQRGGRACPPRQRGGRACPHVTGGEGLPPTSTGGKGLPPTSTGGKGLPRVDGREGPPRGRGGRGPAPRQRGGRACPRQRGGRACPPSTGGKGLPPSTGGKGLPHVNGGEGPAHVNGGRRACPHVNGGEGGDRKARGTARSWNCHPETLDAKDTQISADFVGATVQHLKDRYHCPIIYLSGTVGGLMTSLKVEVKDEAGKALADGTFEKTQRYGQLVGKLAEKALATSKPVRLAPITVRSREVFLPMDNRLFKLGRLFGVLDRQAYLWTGDTVKAEAAGAKESDKPLCLRTEVGWLRLGELEAAAIPGEIYPELVLDKVQDPPDPGADFPDAPIEPAIYKQMRSPWRMMIGLANDEIGYIIPKRQWDKKPPFCYGRTKAQYGEANSVGPETAPILCNVFKELAAGK